ncbi:MAG: sigma-70 family RNA polymerase sigma factor [Oscillospiraceae bacterium]|nr:sigma-70 family RNA polymerase sigma factor [Oscillospiraceae bacterium]MBQ8216892.1 sigma-70 family RNA polymerase sigma factor [Oscillospiraceae bacterium]
MELLFEQEFEKHEKALFLVALSYVHNTEDAKDIVQEAALSAFQAMDTLKYPEYFKTWMTRIVINKSKNFLKGRRLTEALDDSLNIFAAIPTEELEMMDAILRLGEGLSVYISLRFYSDMNYEEAAQALGQNVSTVKYRTRKALNELKKILEGDVEA